MLTDDMAQRAEALRVLARGYQELEAVTEQEGREGIMQAKAPWLAIDIYLGRMALLEAAAKADFGVSDKDIHMAWRIFNRHFSTKSAGTEPPY